MGLADESTLPGFGTPKEYFQSRQNFAESLQGVLGHRGLFSPQRSLLHFRIHLDLSFKVFFNKSPRICN